MNEIILVLVGVGIGMIIIGLCLLLTFALSFDSWSEDWRGLSFEGFGVILSIIILVLGLLTLLAGLL